MPTFRDLNAYYKYLQKQVNSAMEKQVANSVKEVMKEHIEKDVYDAYTPTPEGFSYVRTYQLLEDVNTELIDDGTLELKDTRHDPYNPEKDIVKIIETGKGYTWGFGRNLNEEIGPRPFVELTREELISKKTHVNALKEALKEKGIDTE